MPAAIFLKNNMLDAAVCADSDLIPSDTFRHVRFCGFFFRNLQAGGHGSLTPSHANEAMEFRPEENVDAHSCTCIVETFDKLLLFRVSLQD